MASRPEASRPVEVQGSLHLDTPGGRSLELVADGNSLRMEVSRWRDVRDLVPRSFRGRRQSLRLLAKVFATHGLTFSLESAGKPVFRLGHDATPGLLSRLLGLAPAYIPLSAVRLLLRG